ncbi:MAG: MATE family multidrug resistance protein, partial [Candidatus Marinamargulisbacteria bacterium]
LRIDCLTAWIEVIGLVLLHSLQGAGATTTAMIASVISQWAVFLPAVFLIGVLFKFGLLGVWIAGGAYHLFYSTIFIIIWHRAKWTNIKI